MIIKRSRERSIGQSICLYSALWKNRGSDPDTVWHRRGPRIRQMVGFGDRSTGTGTFGGTFGARHCNQWGFNGMRVPQCLNRRSCGLGWCVWWAEALLNQMGVNEVQREGEVLGVFVLHFYNGKCHCVADGEMFLLRTLYFALSSVALHAFSARCVYHPHPLGYLGTKFCFFRDLHW